MGAFLFATLEAGGVRRDVLHADLWITSADGGTITRVLLHEILARLHIWGN